MKFYANLIISFVLLLAISVSAEEKKFNPPVVATNPKKVKGQFIVINKPPLNIKLVAKYRLSKANDDGSFSGILTYQLSENSRRKLASFAGVSESDIPLNYEQKEVISHFGKDTGCPMIQLDIKANNLVLSSGSLQFQKLSLTMFETEHPASRTICTHARQLHSNWGHLSRPLITVINRLLAGEGINDMSPQSK